MKALITGLLGLVLLVVALITGALYLGVPDSFSVQAFEETIQGWGAWGVLGSMGLMILHSFVPFPAEFLAIANGMVYGPIWGTVVTWIGAMMGAFLAFGLARALGRPFVDIMVAKKNWYVLDEWAAARGGRLVLISRFIPVIAFNHRFVGELLGMDGGTLIEPTDDYPRAAVEWIRQAQDYETIDTRHKRANAQFKKICAEAEGQIDRLVAWLTAPY